MRQIETVGYVPVPEGVTVTCNSRLFTVKGPRGELKRDLRHMTMDAIVTKNADGETIVKITKHFSKSKQVACIRTACTHVKNMITGVTKGYQYKMRLVYAHFPINVNIEKNGSLVEIRNFLGEKRVRSIKLLEGVKAEKCSDVKDQLLLSGNSIENVSRSCALINNSCLVRNKDIRKFLDGIYISERGLLTQD